MAFVDEVSIQVHSGAGGRGCISFRREKFIPMGGPNGGNGGHGGSVFLIGTRNKHSLLDFKFQPLFRAERGEHGKGKEMDGAAGKDMRVEVPLGTSIYAAETGDLLADLVDENQSFLAAKGGVGGKGNKFFTSSVQRAPRHATPGKPGESVKLRLELRLIADIGLVGLPNAGKSSFLRKVSRAQPKVADYPFTTLSPLLGVAQHKDRSLVFADLPGLIEGASQGTGLGHRFLKHVSRTRALLHLVDISHDEIEIIKNVRIIRKELKEYGICTEEKSEILVFNKQDLLPPKALAQKKKHLAKLGLNGYFISNHTGEGMPSLLNALIQRAESWEHAVT